MQKSIPRRGMEAVGWMSFSLDLLVAEIWINHTRPWALFAKRSQKAPA